MCCLFSAHDQINRKPHSFDTRGNADCSAVVVVDHQPAHSCCKSTSCASQVAYVTPLLASLIAPFTQHRMLCTLLMVHSTLRLTLSGTAFLILKLICYRQAVSLGLCCPASQLQMGAFPRKKPCVSRVGNWCKPDTARATGMPMQAAAYRCQGCFSCSHWVWSGVRVGQRVSHGQCHN